jgi:hypothetical protein
LIISKLYYLTCSKQITNKNYILENIDNTIYYVKTHSPYNFKLFNDILLRENIIKF